MFELFDQIARGMTPDRLKMCPPACSGAIPEALGNPVLTLVIERASPELICQPGDGPWAHVEALGNMAYGFTLLVELVGDSAHLARRAGPPCPGFHGLPCEKTSKRARVYANAYSYGKPDPLVREQIRQGLLVPTSEDL